MNLKDLAAAIGVEKLAKLDKDDLLESIGLETRKGSTDYLVPGLLIFGAGLAVGVGVGMLLAPQTGEQLRNQLGETFTKGIEQGRAQLDQVKQKVGQQSSANGSQQA